MSSEFLGDGDQVDSIALFKLPPGSPVVGFTGLGVMIGAKWNGGIVRGLLGCSTIAAGMRGFRFSAADQTGQGAYPSEIGFIPGRASVEPFVTWGALPEGLHRKMIMHCFRKHVKQNTSASICIIGFMSNKENADPAAAALAGKKWGKIPAKKRSEHARMMAEARWAGHEAKRPASSRKKKTR